ncbi:MAG: hypothetical protein ACP5N3_04130 [Candidatus Nanoarchaeia archaeon]
MVKSWSITILNESKKSKIKQLKKIQNRKGIVVKEETNRLLFLVENPVLQKTISASDVEFLMTVLLKGRSCKKDVDYKIEVLE